MGCALSSDACLRLFSLSISIYRRLNNIIHLCTDRCYVSEVASISYACDDSVCLAAMLLVVCVADVYLVKHHAEVVYLELHEQKDRQEKTITPCQGDTLTPLSQLHERAQQAPGNDIKKLAISAAL